MPAPAYRLVVRAYTEAPRPGGGGAAPQPPPLRPLRSSQLEHHDSPTLHPHHDIDQAERELVNYCASLEPGDDRAEACWDAWRFLEAKRDSAVEECELGADAGAGGPSPGSCSKLDQLDAFMHELNGGGEVSGLVAALGTLSRAEARAAARAAAPAPTPPSTAEEEHVLGGELPPKRKAELTALFHAVDSNGDGRIDPEELRAALAQLGEELPSGTVGTMLDAFSASSLSLEQFMQVVEAEEVQSKAAVDRLWRRHAVRPSWWA